MHGETIQDTLSILNLIIGHTLYADHPFVVIFHHYFIFFKYGSTIVLNSKYSSI
jgi:hypothetical protein